MIEYSFFHWSCDKCGVFGGVQLPIETPTDEILNACQEIHDDEDCDAPVKLEDFADA